MLKLIPYELLKIWHKRSFAVFMGVLLILNVIMLWYTTMPKDGEAPLSAYKALSSDLSRMEEDDKYNYIIQMKEEIDGVSAVAEILSLQARGDEMGAALAENSLAKKPDIIEKYMQKYKSGEYLKYTDNLYTEKALLDEIYDELTVVSGYDAYLERIRNRKELLNGISVFGETPDDDFSHQNMEKSAYEHAGLNSENIRYLPSKGIHIALESPFTDLLLIPAVFLFIGSLITEEKEKGLLYITRATRNGIANSIIAKLLALLVHVIAMCLLLYGSNLIFAGIQTGLCDFSAQLQSVPSYLESSLSITMLEYTLLCLVTKAMVLFGFGAVITAISVGTAKSYLPQLAGIGWLGINWICYVAIPAYSDLNVIKYLSFFGCMKTEYLYGGYLNLNIAGHAVSRRDLSLMMIGVFCAAGLLVSFLLFCKGKSLEVRKIYQISLTPFRPHGSLWRHEAYKILFTNKALILLTAFALLIGYRDLSRTYSPSVSEQYYATIMTDLQGSLTAEKEKLVLSEQARFEEAKSQVERIDEQCAAGRLDKNTAEQMKMQWYGVLVFYPAFQRVEAQYEHVKASDGEFIYDTGYQYLFGTLDDSFLIDLLFLTMGVIAAFGNVMAMEEEKQSWHLLAATARGKWQIIYRKIAVCAAATGIMALLPWIFRFISISRVYPMGEFLSATRNLPMYFEWNVGLPIIVFLIISVFSQIIAMLLVSAVILWFSYKRKSYLQASFLALLILTIPLIASMMGMDFAKWFSVYPIYSWMLF